MGTTVQIKHRYTGAVLFECEAPEGLDSGLHVRHALEKAVKAGAYLGRANLADADLGRANLAGANLAGANLADANLEGANLEGANLAGANLARANLEGANLAGAYLARANLEGANLAGADIEGEKITKAPLQLSGLRWAVLITEQFMRIGCQRHSHAEWARFTGDEISGMAGGASEFWAVWGPALLALCAGHAPATESIQEAA